MSLFREWSEVERIEATRYDRETRSFARTQGIHRRALDRIRNAEITRENENNTGGTLRAKFNAYRAARFAGDFNRELDARGVL